MPSPSDAQGARAFKFTLAFAVVAVLLLIGAVVARSCWWVETETPLTPAAAERTDRGADDALMD